MTLTSRIEGIKTSETGAIWEKAAYWPDMEHYEIFTYGATNVRRRLGYLEAKVGIFFKGRKIGYDTFRMGKAEDQRRLQRQAYKQLTAIDGFDIASLYSELEMLYDLQLFCDWIDENWEAANIEVSQFDPDEKFPILQRILYPYVLEGAGTIVHAPGGSGKSYLCQIIAVCIALGINDIWQVVQRPVLYVNLERSAPSFGRRELMIRQALGIKGKSGVNYLHARGRQLKALSPSIKKFSKENPGAVVLLDSVSRASNSSLKEDETANTFINEMNATDSTWLGIGHVTKLQPGKIFGSIMFENGIDVGVTLTPGKKGNTRFIKLDIMKANDIAWGDSEYLALDFYEDGSGLEAIRKASANEFPKSDSENRPLRDQLLDYIMANGAMTATQAAKVFRENPGNVSRLFNEKNGPYRKAKTEGNMVYYEIDPGWMEYQEAIGE